ncbi:VWD domain-containing protein [Solwaraspora sp. WMMD792]|uniref:VWD domain-containing protein n=1 Tax=Solwaraspora sp. WMMD792 TaxID=3016099 RepID=UPI002417872F|nr:VWD domain-containing protein [Solwaraspora sp. WMMD792]MDG4773058.1 VWD domain-containing protein [Solwaraspora sp. WMMD792]
MSEPVTSPCRRRPGAGRWAAPVSGVPALVGVLLVAGCGWFDRNDELDRAGDPAAGQVAGYSSRPVSDFLPAGVTVQPGPTNEPAAPTVEPAPADAPTGPASGYRVRAWDSFSGPWGDGVAWPGTLRLALPGPATRPTAYQVSSAGSMPLPQPAVHVLKLDGDSHADAGTAKVLTDRAGRRIGALVASPGRYGSVLDIDGDDTVDVLDVITVDPPGRLVALNAAGEAYQAALIDGTADCTGAGPAGWDPPVRLVLDCTGGPAAAVRPAVGPSPVPAVVPVGYAQPGSDAVDVVVTAEEAAAAVTGAGQPPTADDIADAAQLAQDLERYGGAVVAGAVLNDLLSDSMPSWLPEVLAWVGDQTGAGVDAGAAGRLLSRSTDDLLDLARIEILLLGGDDPATPDGDGDDAAAGGCELRDAQTGACYDGQDGVGQSWGDPHLRTFDGLDYDFQAVGEFVLARFADDDAEVQVRYRPYRDSDRLSTTGAVGIQLPGGVVRVEHPGSGAGSVTVTVAAGPPAGTSSAGDLLDPAGRRTVGDQQVIRSGRTVQVGLPGGGRVFVVVRPALLDVTVVPAGRPVTGLLGDADGDRGNDLRTAVGQVVDPAAPSAGDIYGGYADSWRLTDATSVLPYPDGTGTDDFTDRDFPAAPTTLAGLPARQRAAATALCRHLGVADPALLAGCVLDVAATGEPAFTAGAAGAQRIVGRTDDDHLLEVGDRRYPVRGWADGIDRAAAVEAGVVGKDPADALGPRDVRNVQLGEGDTECEFPMQLRLSATPLVDGPGPDLGVVQIGAGDARYQVWVAAAGTDRWRWAGSGDGPTVFDLAGVLGPGEQADRIRLCDPPADVDGPRRGRSPLGPAIDAVAALGITDAVAVPR